MLPFLLSKIESLESRDLVKRVAEACFSLAHLFLKRVPFGKKCPVCAAKLLVISRPVMGEKLAEQWGLNTEWVDFFNHREGEICISCGASLRVRQLATVLLDWAHQRGSDIGNRPSSVPACKTINHLKIAEINSCGALHKFLADMPGLAYSEYLPADAHTPHEDLLSLSYADNTFDVVLHSDTIEHVPDITRALEEIWRILKPGGVTIFSIPWVRDGRKTLMRARLNGEEIEHLALPSYHGGSYQTTMQYLVFYEFGADFLTYLNQTGFQTTLTEIPGNPTAVTLTAQKPLQKCNFP